MKNGDFPYKSPFSHGFPMVFPWFSHVPNMSKQSAAQASADLALFSTSFRAAFSIAWGWEAQVNGLWFDQYLVYYEDGLTYENPWKNIWENMRNLHMKWCSLFGVPGFWPIPYPFNFCESCEKNTTPWSSLVVPSANCYCLISTYLDCGPSPCHWWKRSEWKLKKH